MTKRPAPHSHPISGLGILLLIIVFSVTALFCVILSVRAFSSVQNDITADSETRLINGYFRSKLRAHDRQGAIQLDTVNGKQYLILEENGLKDVISCRNGMLSEMLWDPADPFDDELGEPITALTSLAFEYEAPVLHIVYSISDGSTRSLDYSIHSKEAVQ